MKYKGGPATNVQVDFIPDAGGPTFTTTTDGTGRYSVEMPTGPCKVTVIAPTSGDAEAKGKSIKDPRAARLKSPSQPGSAADKPSVPAKYASPDSTPFVVTVSSSPTLFDMNLED